MPADSHLRLQDALERVFDGGAAGDGYRTSLQPDLGAWRRGLDGSMNIPRLARAIQARVEPAEASDWWAHLLDLEWRNVDDDTRRFRWCTWECFSPLYWVWNWLAEACALRFLAEASRAGGDDGAEGPRLGTALTVLRRSLERHALLWSLVSVPEMVVRGRRQQVRFRGPGTLCAGLRGNPKVAHFRGVDKLGPLAARRPTDVDLIKGTVSRLAPRIRDWGVGDATATVLGGVLDHDRDALRRVASLLGDCRTVVPYRILRYSDGTVVTYLTENGSGNTSAIWFCRQGPGPEQVELLYPYDERRVRSGHPDLGRGEGWVEAADGRERFHCANLTEEEHRRRGSRAERIVREAALPAARPLLDVELGPDHPPVVHVEGEHLGGGAA